MVSIHGPLGYGPSTLPLRHSAACLTNVKPMDQMLGLEGRLIFSREFRSCVKVEVAVLGKLQTLVYDILPSTGGRCRKAVFGVCVLGSRAVLMSLMVSVNVKQH